MKQVFCLTLLLFLLLVCRNQIYAAFVIQNAPVKANEITQSNFTTQYSFLEHSTDKVLSTRPKEKNGFLAYFSIGCALLGLALASPHLSLVLVVLGTAAGISGKMGLKAYRDRTFLRVLCVLGIVLGVVVVALGTIPIIFLTL
ncbi:hypothetical protein GC194_10940 [bacterium]|nr:hypothetical protein [bacterium]